MGSCNSCPSKGTCGKDEQSCGIVNNPQNKIKKAELVNQQCQL